MSKIEVDAIDKQSGSTLTLGGSGTAVTLACGATQTGFGRTGTVDWQTGSIKTATFTAANGEGYFCNTSGGAFTVNLPAGSAGAIISVSDYTRTFQTNNLTISPNGSEKIGGIAQDATLSTEGQSATFVYVDATEGWINTQETSNSVTGVPPFIQATGGTPSQDGDYEIRTFTSPGTFQVTSLSPTPACNAIDWVIIGGGGGGGTTLAGGGGAGGYKESPGTSTGSYSGSPTKGQGCAVTATVTSYPIVVDGGGAGATGVTTHGTAGGVSSALGITSAGGGYGAGVASANGGAGGSGGGGSGCGSSTSGGAGNTPPSSPAQGEAGGAGRNVPGCRGGGGGGGAGAAGTPGQPPYAGGAGGVGVSTSITGSSVQRSGGGGGGGNSGSPDRGGAGGAGGGGRGGGSSPTSGVAGTANTGGGGGGGAGSNPSEAGGNGGSGVVIIRYKVQ